MPLGATSTTLMSLRKSTPSFCDRNTGNNNQHGACGAGAGRCRVCQPGCLLFHDACQRICRLAWLAPGTARLASAVLTCMTPSRKPWDRPRVEPGFMAARMRGYSLACSIQETRKSKSVCSGVCECKDHRPGCGGTAWPAGGVN